MAASWSITWPGYIVGFFVLGFLMPTTITQAYMSKVSLFAAANYLLWQAILTPRLYRKKYRSFRIEVQRNNDEPTKTLSIGEILQLAARILWPQAVFLLAVACVLNWASRSLEGQAARSISSALLWVRFLVIGPFSIQYALRSQYREFRLQTYAERL